MKYLSILMLFVVLYACNKDKTPVKPGNTVPDSLLHKFTGTYKLFDSFYIAKNNNLPPGGWTDSSRHNINADIIITLDSFRKELTYDDYIYKISKEYNDLNHFTCYNMGFHSLTINEDSISIIHFGSLPGHTTTTSYVNGYRIK